MTSLQLEPIAAGSVGRRAARRAMVGIVVSAAMILVAATLLELAQDAEALRDVAALEAERDELGGRLADLQRWCDAHALGRMELECDGEGVCEGCQQLCEPCPYSNLF